MHPVILAAPTLASQTMPGESQAVVYGVCSITLLFGMLLRARASKSAGLIKRRSLVARSDAAVTVVTHTHTVAGWLALLCFAIAGIASTGTIISTGVLWAARSVTGLTHHIPLPVLVAIDLVALIVAWKAGHLFFDVIDGKAHHGGSDWLVFLGPTLFPLIPGPFGLVWGWAYRSVAQLVMRYAIELATKK